MVGFRVYLCLLSLFITGNLFCSEELFSGHSGEKQLSAAAGKPVVMADGERLGGIEAETTTTVCVPPMCDLDAGDAASCFIGADAGVVTAAMCGCCNPGIVLSALFCGCAARKGYRELDEALRRNIIRRPSVSRGSSTQKLNVD